MNDERLPIRRAEPDGRGDSTLSLGMRATVNSDDPAYFRAYVNENLRALQDEGGLTRNEIVQLVSNAFTVAWLDETRRASYLERVHSYVDRN